MGFRAGHLDAARIIAIEHTNGIRAEDTCFRIGIGIHVAMPVEMILRDIEYGCSIRIKAECGEQLKAGQLQHPALWQFIIGNCIAQYIQRSRADIASDFHGQTCSTAQLPGETGDGGFAIGASDGNDLGLVITLGLQCGECLREEFDFTPDRNVFFLRRGQNCGEFIAG